MTKKLNESQSQVQALEEEKSVIEQSKVNIETQLDMTKQACQLAEAKATTAQEEVATTQKIVEEKTNESNSIKKVSRRIHSIAYCLFMLLHSNHHLVPFFVNRVLNNAKLRFKH